MPVGSFVFVKVNLSPALVTLLPPGPETVTSTVPVPVGDVAVIEVGEVIAATVALAVPNVTVSPVLNPVPVIVTLVPPAVGPVGGDTDVTVGRGVVYVYESDGPVALVPPAPVTVTLTVPAPAGDVTVIEVVEPTTTSVPWAAPNVTVSPVLKPVPVIVTFVPPTVGPVGGDTDVTVGAETVPDAT